MENKESSNLKVLQEKVIANSSNKDWLVAKTEWTVTSVEENPECNGICVCGENGLKYLFTITNKINGNVLFPIGSTCIKQFGEKELNKEVSILKKINDIYKKLKNNEIVDFYTDFTRNVIAYLYLDKQGVFGKTRSEETQNYVFIKKVFNEGKNKKLTSLQQQTLNSILTNNIFPYIIKSVENKTICSGNHN